MMSEAELEFGNDERGGIGVFTRSDAPRRNAYQDAPRLTMNIIVKNEFYLIPKSEFGNEERQLEFGNEERGGIGV